MSLNGACLGIFDKIQQSEKEFEIRGFKGELSKTQITSNDTLKLRVTFKKLNIITGRKKSIQYRLESMLFWHDRTLFCHSVTTHSRFLKI